MRNKQHHTNEAYKLYNIQFYPEFLCPYTITTLIRTFIRQWLVLRNIACKRRVILWCILAGVIHVVICRKCVRYETKNVSSTGHISVFTSAWSLKVCCCLQHSIMDYSSCCHPHSFWPFIIRNNYYPDKAIMQSRCWSKALFQPMLSMRYKKTKSHGGIFWLIITKYIRILHIRLISYVP